MHFHVAKTLANYGNCALTPAVVLTISETFLVIE